MGIGRVALRITMHSATDWLFAYVRGPVQNAGADVPEQQSQSPLEGRTGHQSVEARAWRLRAVLEFPRSRSLGKRLMSFVYVSTVGVVVDGVYGKE